MKNTYSIFAELKANLALSLPLMAAWLIYSLGPFAGTAMIAHLGKDALAASALVGTIWIAGISFCFGLFNAVSVLISQQMGAKNAQAVGEIMGQALLLNACSWWPLIGLMWAVPCLVQWSTANPDILLYAKQYAHALSFAVPGLITLLIVEHFLSGIGKTQMSLWISLIEIPIEIVFIYICVFGKGGMPAFGIAGVGYGLAFSFTLTSLVILLYLSYAKFTQPFQIFHTMRRVNWTYWKAMLNIGLPIGFTYFIELVGFTIATYFISTFSNIALAAHQIVLQFEAVIFNIPFAIAQALTVRIGLSVGQLDKKSVILASYVGIIVGFLLSLVIFFLFALFPLALLRIDLDLSQQASLIEMASSLLFILGLYQVFDSIRILEAGALRGLKDTSFTMYTNIVCFSLLGVLFAYIIGIVFNYQVQGIWYGLMLGLLLDAILLFFRLKKIIKTANLSHILAIK